jgi:hypothetical protein
VSRRRLILLLGFCAVVIAAFLWFLGDPQKRETRRVRKRLTSLAEDASFGPRDHPFTKLAYPGKVAGYFAETVYLEIPNITLREDVTRSHLESVLGGFRAQVRGLDVQFIDIMVEFRGSLTNAVAHLTSKIYVTGDQGYGIQEFQIGLQKLHAQWEIHRITTVRTMDK